jgi:hypothetical protein
MGIREKLERIMMAITFAEAGEHDTAREFLKERKQTRLKPHWKRTVVQRRSRHPLRAPRLP